MCERLTPRLSLILMSLFAVLLAAGCGRKQPEAPTSVVLAEVGDRQITSDYYKERLARLQEENLPRDEAGQVLDMASLEGKRKFLDVIIDKELMVAKALQLGYLQDDIIAIPHRAMIEYQAMIHFWIDKVGDPSRLVTNADLEHYYSRVGEKRKIEYLIALTRDQALEARRAVQEGMPWSEAVARFHFTNVPVGSRLENTIPWGEYREDIQNAVFALNVGGCTEPIETEHGWWIMRLLDITIEPEKPDIETVKEYAIPSIAKRREFQLRESVINELKRQRNFMLDEEALLIVLNGLPEGEVMVDPVTKKPTPREELKPLAVSVADGDRLLMRYDLESGPYVLSIAQYKDMFDQQNVFERPKKSEGLGRLRSKLATGAERKLLEAECFKNGYKEDPRVKKAAFGKIEEMLVDRINKEVVSYDEEVLPADVQAYYDEHRDAFKRPERRTGIVMRCADQERAQAARQSWRDGSLAWQQLVKQYAADPKLTLEQAKIGPVSQNNDRPVNRHLFALTLNEISEPFELEGGWAIVMLESILPSEIPELKDVRQLIGKQITDRRQEEALRRLLDRWREEFGVIVYDERLAAMPSWAEAVAEASRATVKLPGA